MLRFYWEYGRIVLLNKVIVLWRGIMFEFNIQMVYLLSLSY